MIYDAGDKKERRAMWATTNAPHRSYIRWCLNKCKGQIKRQGKFYFHYSNTKWWFEFADDAEWFNTVLAEINKKRLFEIIKGNF